MDQINWPRGEFYNYIIMHGFSLTHILETIRIGLPSDRFIKSSEGVQILS